MNFSITPIRDVRGKRGHSFLSTDPVLKTIGIMQAEYETNIGNIRKTHVTAARHPGRIGWHEGSSHFETFRIVFEVSLIDL